MPFKEQLNTGKKINGDMQIVPTGDDVRFS